MLFMQSESSILREQLLLEFVPEDVCPLGAQILVDATRLDFKFNESPVGGNCTRF